MTDTTADCACGRVRYSVSIAEPLEQRWVAAIGQLRG
jgi:hypothetical protein